MELLDLLRKRGMDGDVDSLREAFLGRPLDGAPYPCVWLDALTQKVREGEHIRGEPGDHA